jgi:segregation and condensation protein B
MDLSAVIEALLIASEEPLTSSELARLVRARLAEIEDGGGEEEGDYGKAGELGDDLKKLSAIDEESVIAAISNLNMRYERGKRSFLILERSKGWKVFTRPEYSGFIRQLFPGLKPRRLSPPAMETLAIIAYRQPVTKASIEHVRGVSTDRVLQKLLDRELVKIEGRAELPGRPLLYATTDLFFEHFGIKSIDELPNSVELRAIELPDPPSPEGEGDDQSESQEGEEKQLTLVEPSGELAPAEEPPEDFSSPESGDPAAN